MKPLEQTYLEANATGLLSRAGLTKAAFAERMGVKPQNVNKVFETKNVCTLMKAAEVLGVPFETLVRGVDEKENTIDGFIEVNGIIHRVRCREDLESVLKLL